LNKEKNAKENYQSAVEIYKKIGTESIKCPNTLSNIGLMHYFQKEYAKALEYYGRAETIHKKIGNESIGWANTLRYIGAVYGNQDKAT
jgi:tetratricopeptide (TPR) repeat protein